MKFAQLLSAAALGTAAVLALSSCSTSGEGAAAQSDRLQVVTTTTQLADFSAIVGGDNIELTSLMKPGSSAHHFDPTPGDLLAIGKADVLVINGVGLDEFIDNSIDASGFKGTIIDASTGVDLVAAAAISDEGKEGDEHAEEEEHDHSHGHGHGDEHDHGDLNPHLWTSPKQAEGMVKAIAVGLAKVDPSHSKDYTGRADDYNKKLSEMNDWIAAEFEKVPAEDRVLVTGHDSLRYYLHDYSIDYAGSLLPSFEDNAEPSAAEVDALVAAIKDRGVKAIFVESSLSPKLAQAVAKEAGVKVIDADTLFVDSLGPAGSGAETYISATLHNTNVILDAWGVKADPIPNNLENE
ncbi:metal ABC transporter substrate-binding protein [Leucobacter sp. UT-8R-CII-1-4]|uniref:metal ABC transporter substrate-binding protein n=1 Tax=Leucobacter sp. UT-8R-CII-1-4 TaxID=3040075 RepID=UPI0024A9208D|nr:metal ABC transporter substrate-binding protein [Leucobacter sp. UT-8R-CII-1-4]MDI6023527.1 metal ABC transporter substrate-binding protein [Leucobacter sp. UT-8R-CII-1-4]